MPRALQLRGFLRSPRANLWERGLRDSSHTHPSSLHNRVIPAFRNSRPFPGPCRTFLTLPPSDNSRLRPVSFPLVSCLTGFYATVPIFPCSPGPPPISSFKHYGYEYLKFCERDRTKANDKSLVISYLTFAVMIDKAKCPI